MNLFLEKKLSRRGFCRVAGVDEVGRGSLAGPVVASAIVFKNLKISKKILREIKDSKQLSPKKREEFFALLKNSADCQWQVAKVSAKVIDRINIEKATYLAMCQAVKKIKNQPDILLIDGNRFSAGRLKIPYKTIIKGDEKIFSIAAASIIAKVTRDRLMIKMAKIYPEYGFEIHKGYGTKKHFRRVKKFGLSEIHRRSFLRGLVS
ncbi:MAG: ribonuclease HII [Parcubacteria group bacterium]|nr:ribonuclease HII [Parcubacteria group bacterium]